MGPGFLNQVSTLPRRMATTSPDHQAAMLSAVRIYTLNARLPQTLSPAVPSNALMKLRRLT